MYKNLIRGVAVALTLTLAAPALLAQQTAAPQPPAKKPQQSFAELEQMATKALENEDWVRWYSASSKMHKRRPFVPDYMVNIVLASALLDQKRTAYHYMLQLQQQGFSYDFNQWDETELIRGTEAYDHINKLMIEAGKPFGEGEPQLELEVAPADLGDVAWDASRQRFLVGTLTDGRVLAVADDGSDELLLKASEANGLWSINGLAVDTENNRLWVSSSASPLFTGYTAADANRGALFEFELDSLEPVGRYNLPVDALPHSLGSIAPTRGGEVYVVDRATPIVYRKAADGSKLEPFVFSPELVALTDIAVTPDNSRLFVADAIMGILLVDPIQKRTAMLSGPENFNMYGVYGVEYLDRNLVITQSGMNPQRILKLELDPTGSSVENVTPVASALEGFDTPGAGSLRAGSLYYFANHGSLSQSEKLSMMYSPLDAGEALGTPNMNDLGKAMQQGAETPGDKDSG